MAQMVGVEPTRQSPVLKHFECSLLRPLEYICIFNFVARNFPQGVISSQSRYDHFDTAPYLSQHQHLGKRGELMGRTSKNIKLRIPEKLHKIKGFRSGSYRVATTISSAPSYDLLSTSAYLILLRGTSRKVRFRVFPLTTSWGMLHVLGFCRILN